MVVDMEEDVRIDTLFNSAYDNLYCNTSYPLRPELWQKYKVENYDIMKDTKQLSFYIHIPFCAQLCKFCEYTRFKNDDENLQEQYIKLLENQIKNFIDNHEIEKIYGIDIGGGTPTSISFDNLEKIFNLIQKIENKYKKVDNYEKSIEISFNTISLEKIKLIKQYGFNRISVGLQVMNKKMLDENNREYTTLKKILEIRRMIQNIGIEKLNIDIMYGLKNQTEDNIESTLNAIKIINPEQVTLYEMRYNMVDEKTAITREELYSQYKKIYNFLIKMGYIGRFGSNTFSKYEDDGVSSYLKYRMKFGIPYKGFGISAQSMSWNGVSYNNGKNRKKVEDVDWTSIYEEDIYSLPKEEILAKYVSVSLYNGSFNLNVMSNILEEDALKVFEKEFQYLLDKKYIELIDDICYITQKGFKYYGAIGTLFWSKEHKEYLMRSNKCN